MRRALLVPLLLALVAPTVSACSFAGPGPALPARIWVWDLDAQEAIDQIDLYSRELDGDCGLIHPVDLDARRLVYADQAGDSMGVWLHLVGQDGPPRLVFRLDGRYIDLDLDGDLLSVYLETHRYDGKGEDPDRFHHVFVVDLETGAAERIDIETDWLGNPEIEDGLLFWDWVSREDYHHRLNVYDLHASEWIYQNVSYEDTFALEGRPRIETMNERWILFGGTHVYDRLEERMHTRAEPIDLRKHLTGDRVYVSDYDGTLRSFALPDGAGRPEPALAHPVFRNTVIHDGLIVLGIYSAKDGDASRPQWMRDPELTTDFPIPKQWEHESPKPFFLPGPEPVVLVVALALIVRMWRRPPP